MAYCSQSFSRAWDRSIRLLFQPFRLFFWLKTALLAFFIHGFSSIPAGELWRELPPPEDLDRWRETLNEILPLLIGIFLGSILIGILMEAVRACARFLFFDAVWQGTSYYRSGIQRHFSGILSLFLWNIFIKIVFFTLLAIGLIILLIPNLALSAFFDNWIVLVLVLTIDFLIVVTVVLLGIVYSFLMQGIVIPQMVVQSKGILESWRDAIRISMYNMGETLGFIVIRLLLTLMEFFLIFFFALLVSLFTVGIFALGSVTIVPDAGILFGEQAFHPLIQMPMQFLIVLLLLPFPIVKDIYALCFLKNILTDNRFEPGNGSIHTQGEDTVSAFEEILDKKDETGPWNRPVSFKDIPTLNPGSKPNPVQKSDSEAMTDPDSLPPSRES